MTNDQWQPELYGGKHSFVWKLGASLIEQLAPKAGERILDIGCGTGQLTAEIGASGASVVGIDNSPAMIDAAQRSYADMTFCLMDATCFDVGSDFDAVFSNAALHWIQEPERVMDCVSRALKPSGRFVVEFGGQGNVRHLTAAIESAAQRVLSQTIQHPWYFPGVVAFGSVVETHGLEVTHAALIDRPTPLDGADGLRNWVRMFGQHWLSRIPDSEQESFLSSVEDLARPQLYRDNIWYADYRRLRLAARR